jgi:hypothetical protein
MRLDVDCEVRVAPEAAGYLPLLEANSLAAAKLGRNRPTAIKCYAIRRIQPSPSGFAAYFGHEQL